MLSRGFWLSIVVALSLSLALTACGGEPTPTVEGSPAPEGREGDSEDKGESAKAAAAAFYSGLGLDVLDSYAAAFEITFTPDGDPALAWTYRLDTLASPSPPALRRSLAIEGVDPGRDPGDIVLVLVGDVQYMTGEAVGATGCLTFPAGIDVETSFLTPDDLLPPPALDTALIPAGRETVAGQEGTRYTFEAGALGDFSDASGELVLADEGGYALRYAFAGDTVDTRFAVGQAGRLAWRFEVTDLAPGEVVTAPEGCEVDFPIMPDAVGVVRLPGLIAYTSPSSSQDVQAFYEEALPIAGWERYSYPATGEDATLLVYARAGELLNLSITAVEGGTEVQIFIEDRPAE